VAAHAAGDRGAIVAAQGSGVGSAWGVTASPAPAGGAAEAGAMVGTGPPALSMVELHASVASGEPAGLPQRSGTAKG